MGFGFTIKIHCIDSYASLDVFEYVLNKRNNNNPTTDMSECSEF